MVDEADCIGVPNTTHCASAKVATAEAESNVPDPDSTVYSAMTTLTVVLDCVLLVSTIEMEAPGMTRNVVVMKSDVVGNDRVPLMIMVVALMVTPAPTIKLPDTANVPLTVMLRGETKGEPFKVDLKSCVFL